MINNKRFWFIRKKIMRKRSHECFDDGPPRKKLSREGVATKKITGGEVLTDLTGKEWKVGKVIGHGGFGEIFTASKQLQGPVKNDAPYVVKIENHSNGPLFVEVNCYMRIAKSETSKFVCNSSNYVIGEIKKF